MSYDVNKIIEESVANIMEDPKEEDILQEGVETNTPEENLEETEGMFLLDEDAFFESQKFLSEYVGMTPEASGKKA